jgi:predicted permease
MREFLRRTWYVIRRRRFEADLAEEIEFHREMKTRELCALGAAPDAAAREARRLVGSTALAQDRARDVWVWRWLQDAVQDVRFATRLLVKDRRLTLAAIAALSIGIAANTTIFSFINTALFKDLPFDEPRQLVDVGTRDSQGRPASMSYLDLQDIRAATHTLAGLAAYSGATMNLSEPDRAPERLRGEYVSANTFALLRVTPILGRAFVSEDERQGAPAALIISSDVWRRRYASDPAVIRRAVRVNGEPATIIGVMPFGFRYPGTTEAWQPLSLLPGVAASSRAARNLNAVARLASGVTIEQAQAELTAIGERLAREFPETNRDVATTIAAVLEATRHSITPVLMTMMGAVAFVLLIACANVANLLLSRAAHRAREMAVRASLGATRWRIVRQLLIESILLACVAGVVGLGLAVYGVHYFGVAFDATEVASPERTMTPYWVDLTMDRRVFGFVAALCLGSSIVFGIAPALHIARTNVNDVLKEAGRGVTGGLRARHWTSGLMIGELALTLILLAGAGLLVRSYVALYQVDLVFNPSNLLTARLALPVQKYRTSEEQKAFLRRLDARLVADSSLATAAIGSDIPVVALGGGPAWPLDIEGRTPSAGDAPANSSYVRIGARYFETVGLRLLRGRGFADDEVVTGRSTAIVNQRFSMLFFPNEDPLGRRIRLSTNARAIPGPWLTIVGVAPTLPDLGPTKTAQPIVYVPIHADPDAIRFVSLLVKGRSDGAATVSRLRENVRALDPDLPLFAVQTMDEAVARARFPLRMIGSMFGFLAVSALLLSAVGLFALTAHGVAQHTHEIGIRIALGAQARQLLWMFLRRTLRQLAMGLTIGLVGALAVGQLLQTFLVDIHAHDPLTLAVATALLLVVSIAACVFPARRATRLDPVVALRHD